MIRTVTIKLPPLPPEATRVVERAQREIAALPLSTQEMIHEMSVKEDTEFLFGGNMTRENVRVERKLEERIEAKDVEAPEEPEESEEGSEPAEDSESAEPKEDDGDAG